MENNIADNNGSLKIGEIDYQEWECTYCRKKYKEPIPLYLCYEEQKILTCISCLMNALNNALGYKGDKFKAGRKG